MGATASRAAQATTAECPAWDVAGVTEGCKAQRRRRTDDAAAARARDARFEQADVTARQSAQQFRQTQELARDQARFASVEAGAQRSFLASQAGFSRDQERFVLGQTLQQRERESSRLDARQRLKDRFEYDIQTGRQAVERYGIDAKRDVSLGQQQVERYGIDARRDVTLGQQDVDRYKAGLVRDVAYGQQATQRYGIEATRDVAFGKQRTDIKLAGISAGVALARTRAEREVALAQAGYDARAESRQLDQRQFLLQRLLGDQVSFDTSATDRLDDYFMKNQSDNNMPRNEDSVSQTQMRTSSKMTNVQRSVGGGSMATSTTMNSPVLGNFIPDKVRQQTAARAEMNRSSPSSVLQGERRERQLRQVELKAAAVGVVADDKPIDASKVRTISQVGQSGYEATQRKILRDEAGIDEIADQISTNYIGDL